MADISIRMTADGSAVVSAVQQSNAALQSLGVQATQTSAVIAAADKSYVGVLSQTIDETKRLLNVSRVAAIETQKALDNLAINPDALKIPGDALSNLVLWRDKVAYALGSGAAMGWDAAKTAWEEFKSFTERQVVIWGTAAALGVSAVVLSAVYAVYKSIDFAVGLLTGESYKSANMDAVIAANKEVKSLQSTLNQSPETASATRAAFEVMGVSIADFTTAYEAAGVSVKSHEDEFKRLGVVYQDAHGAMLETANLLPNIKSALDEYTAGWDRNQAAVALGFTSYAQVKLALKAQSATVGEAGARLNDYNLVVGAGTQQAISRYQEAMDAFNRETELTSQGIKRAISDQIMPILTDFAEFFRDGFPTAVNAFRYSMAVVTSLFYGLKTVAFMVTESVIGGVSAIGSVLSGAASAGMKALSGDFTGAKNALVQGWSDAKARIGQSGDAMINQAAKNSAAMALAWGTANSTASVSATAAAKTGKAWVAASDEAAVAQKEQISDYEKLRRVIMEKQSTDDLQLVTSSALTESDKIRAKMQADLASGAIKLTASEIALTGAALEKLKATEKIIAEEKAYQEFIKSRYESSSKLVNAAVEEADKNEALAKTFGMTKAAIEDLEIARLQEQLTSLQGVNQTTAEIAKLDALIDAKKRNRDAVGKLDVLESSAEAAKQAEEDWKKVSESINASLTDALMRGFESGKDFATNMRDTIINAFKTMVLRPVISAIMSPVTAVGAALGGMGSAANATGIGASSAASLLSTGGALAQVGALFPQASSAVLGFTNAAAAGVQSMVGITGTSAQMATSLANAGYYGTSAAGAAAGSAFATAIPYIGAAVLAYSLLTQDHGTPTSNTGSTSRAFDAAGNVTGSESYYGGTSAGADAMIVKMQDAYMQGAKSLGIATVASNFNFSGNTGKNGESPNFALGGGAGGKSFQQTEIKLDDAAVALAASRAVFAALQGSELPVYLAGVFDHLSAGAATQEQITAALAGAQALAAWHTALTALPFDTLTNASYSTMQGLIGAAGGLDKLSGNLAGFYSNFYSSDEKTAALTSNTSKAFADLGLVMPALDASTRANYRSMIEELGAKDLSVEANAKAYTGALALQGAVNELAPAMSAAKSSIKDLAKEMTGFDAAGLGKMILDAAFNPQAGMTAAESFAQALQYSVQNALISSTVGQISDTLYTSIIMPIVAGNAVAQGAMDAVVTDATAKLDALGQLFKSDAFKSAIGSIAQTVAGIMPSLTPMATYTAPVAYVAPVVDTKAADAAKAAADALAQSLKSLGDTSASLAIELLRAQGQQADADAAQRAIDIAGYGAAEIAVYDYNASIRAQITAIGAAKTAAEALVVAENAATAAREAAVQKSFDVTSAGAKTALDALSRAVDADKKLVATAYESASKTAQTALDKITTSVGKLQALATSLKSALDGMRIIGSDGAYRQDAQSQIRAALETARAGGGLPIDGTLTSALATVAKPSEQLFGSFTAYALDFYRTANDISDLSALTSDALSADETTQLILQRQITALKAGFDAENARLDAIVTGATAQLNALNGINTSVLSVVDALDGFAASMGAATTAKAALAAQQARAAALAATPVFDSGTKADVVGQIQSAAAAGGITQEMQLYQTATSSGYTAAQVDKSMGWAPGTSNAWAAEKGLPTFAIGTNFVPTDMTANIHAGERIIPAADNRELMQRLQSPSDNNAVLVAEIRALRAEVAGLRASSERGNESAQRTADTLSGRQGVPFLVQVAA